MRLEILKEKTSSLLLLNKSILRNFEPNENLLAANIKYWLKNGDLIAVKKGVYVLKERYEKERDKDLYLEYIANQIVQPSYISAEYVLAKYQLLSEPVNTITSITVKSTREINNSIGVFRYYSMRKYFFTNYKVAYFYNSPVWEAEKSKALFDYIYLRVVKSKTVKEEDMENLRLNWENFSRDDMEKACSHVSLSNNKNIGRAFDIIRKLYYD